MTAESELVVPAGHGLAFEVRAGQFLTITDVDGQQVGDFVAFKRGDVTEYLHTAHTRVAWNRIYPRVGDVFVSNWLNPVLELVHDDVGQHDLARAICNLARYRNHFGLSEHRSCLQNFAEALAPYGVERYWMPMPVNLFQNSPVRPDGSFDVQPPLSGPGDCVVLRAQMDLVCALSACPMDQIATNGFRVTDLHVRVSDAMPRGLGE